MRRVSFNNSVKVYDLEPEEHDVKEKMHYSKSDYRRFRSDSCLEILDRQLLAQPQNTWNIVWEKVFNAVSLKAPSSVQHQLRIQRQQAAPCSKRKVDYPWLTPYHPQEQQQAQATSNIAKAVEPTIVSATAVEESEETPVHGQPFPKPSDTVREMQLIQELSFFGPPVTF